MTAALAVDSSHMIASSSASWSRFSPPSNFVQVGTCRQCGSWSDAGHNRRKVIGRDTICASLHDMDLALCGNGLAETMYDEGDQNLAVR